MSLHHMLRAAAQQQAGGPSDPYFEYNTLLLTGDGTNGAQNNTFLDSSTNNFTITRNGNTTQGTFSPYGNLWSNYFDGSGDYLTTPSNAAFDFGTGNFTIEAWVYISGNSIANSSGTRPACIFNVGSVSATTLTFYINGNTTTTGTGLNVFNGTSDIAVTQTINQNTWNHIAVCKSGTSVYFWLNGVQAGTTQTTSGNWGSASYSAQVGARPPTGYTFDLNGYISNVRVVKGTALYTSNFTPSTTPLTAVSGTSLLTCQSNRFIDNSSNNFTLTVNGNTSVQRFSPFNPTAPYSAATIGGSGYFDGTGDYLSVPDSAAWDFGTGDFTVEAWVNLNTVSTIQTFINHYQDAGGSSILGWGIQWRSDTGVWNFFYGNTQLVTYTNTPSIGSWNHIAVSRSGTSLKMFLNGSQVASVTNSTNMTGSSNPLLIGALNAAGSGIVQYVNGYISNVRVVKGTAVYTSNFTPPTAPLTAITNTSLLLNFTNAGIPDAAMMNDLETVGNAQVSTSVKKYGTGSLYFDGSGDYLITPDSDITEFGSGDFTIECWVNFASLPTSTNGMAVAAKWASANYSYLAAIYNNSGTMQMFFGYSTNGSATTNILANASIGTGTWYHLAYVRNGSSFKMFLNGSEVTSSATITGSLFNGNQSLNVGRSGDNANYINGYIDDLRITKGYARYTANFTPPTAALPTY